MQNCYSQSGHRGKVKEMTEEQSERLTTKHIQTLGFLQDIAGENKALKERVAELEANAEQCREIHAFAEDSQGRIKDIQEQYLRRADEINEMLLEKHKTELMHVVEEKLAAEEHYTNANRQLTQRVEDLETQNARLLGQLPDIDMHVDQIKMLELKAEALDQDNQRLVEERDQLNEIVTNVMPELHRMQGLREENDELRQQIDELMQKNKEYSYKISKMENEIEPDRSDEETSINMIKSLRAKLTKIHKEKQMLMEKDSFQTKQIEDLNEEIQRLKGDLNNAEMNNDDLSSEIELLRREIHSLNNRLTRAVSADRDKQNFREFVQLKRECVVLRDENDDLRQKMARSKSGSMLPALKATPEPFVKKKSADSKTKTKKGSNEELKLVKK